MSEIPHQALPEPASHRWQPLRLGLLELFHYDSEEFWFRDGHLLLRGNNGTGKSKVLSLTLPLLFDAQLKPARVEPDGDPGKKMSWNLLMGRHERRMGYTWIEFGRVDAAGDRRYLTLGCGLSASAGRAQIDNPWFFLLERARLGQDLWLMNGQRVVLTRERLRDALEPHAGKVFDTATNYRRAVDEHLFHLGQTRYAALMDTLIQLRQPQLSKKPDEASLSNALTQALPPMATDLLADVADALNQLEENRRELAEYEALEHAIAQFNQRYRRYAATQARRQAAALRSAQSGFDAASRALNQDQAALAAARENETCAHAAHAQAEAALQAARTRVETLQADPAMTSAREIEQAQREAAERQRDAAAAEEERGRAAASQASERRASDERARSATAAEHRFAAARAEAADLAGLAGLNATWRGNALAAGEVERLPPSALETARQQLRDAVARRRGQLALVRERCDESERADGDHARAEALRGERADEAESAAIRRAQADAAVEQQAQALVDAWQRHVEGLRQLRITGAAAMLEALAAWGLSLDGENPAHAALLAAQQSAAHTLAARKAELQHQQAALEDEQSELNAERARLEQGEDTVPPAPHWRDAEARTRQAGAPLWQLIDFQPDTPAAARAGLEAALQAAGLLDAWVTPDGALQRADGTRLADDSQWLLRPAQPQSLATYLRPAAEASSAVAATVIERLLRGVACDERDDDAFEAWIAPDGRFRLGALAGRWHKAEAQFIGYAARAAARARRIEDIAARLARLRQSSAEIGQALADVAEDQQRAAAEWQAAPTEMALRAAHAEAGSATRALDEARTRLRQAQEQWQAAAARRDTARAALVRDAEDLALPTAREALSAVEGAVNQFAEALPTLAAAAREHRHARTEHAQQLERERDAAALAERAERQAAERSRRAAEAATRLETLQQSVGAEARDILRRLAEARADWEHGEIALQEYADALRDTGEARARAQQKAEDAKARLAERGDARQAAITQLRDFAATGLLQAAWPEAELPPEDSPWTIDPTLTLARRTELELADVPADDETWNRVQNQVSADYTELGRALTALGHQAQATTSDFGLVVGIIYRNRLERPDRLARKLADEIAQRRESLTASEREVLENHLQAEIASTVQKLMRGAERQIGAINAELHKRPTSTGVRFRLVWQMLPEGANGAPVGLEAARKRLLNTSADLWSAEDRRAVGRMLQQRIVDERNRADAELGGSLLEQLARALDYRSWHRFRVQRWQDGQWRPLTGPASSGERALGLTVPLFAAVSSFYSQSGNPLAPRLVLLDEAFAGIDDAARAHCMALIREFDLDFVITSEREWACYAELPGVAIAQLQRREGIDAVYVSRWTWDGRARQHEPDPERRFPPAPDETSAAPPDLLAS